MPQKRIKTIVENI